MNCTLPVPRDLPRFLKGIEYRQYGRSSREFRGLALTTLRIDRFVSDGRGYTSDYIRQRQLSVHTRLSSRLIGDLRFLEDDLIVVSGRSIAIVRRPPRLLCRTIRSISSLYVPQLQLLGEARRRLMGSRDVDAMNVASNIQVRSVRRKL